MGYEVLQPFAKRANLLPIFILAAKLCPPRAQAAAYIMHMALDPCVYLSQPRSYHM
tara:strand:+ start:1250 stop:1417 length:168 start_codon:yes stop_codon:yes gene_type:complete